MIDKDGPVRDIGSRLELFVDDYLIETLDGVRLELHTPQKMPLAENSIIGGYVTVIKDEDLYQGYYRSYKPGYKQGRYDDHTMEIICYAESRDGHEWFYPELGLHEINGSKNNNVILADQAPFCHNFSPFIDRRPGAGKEERYKALAGLNKTGGRVYPGLFPFVSADGIHWSKMHDGPVITNPHETYNAFDSQNVSFWSEWEKCYVCYFRTHDTPHGNLRSISRTTSEDFIHWDVPRSLHPNLPGEHLYTNGTHPYFRAPHIYIALPTRFVPARGDSTEILFMSSRGSAPYTRLFEEAFIRPGLDPSRWGNRSNYVAQNVVPTGHDEISIYHNHSGHRYVLRTDGFVSVNAPFEGGEMITRPFTFSGSELVLNCSTSATGSIMVEIQKEDGLPVPGYGLGDCDQIVCDRIEQVVTWKGKKDVDSKANTPVRLRFLMKDADLFSLRFR